MSDFLQHGEDGGTVYNVKCLPYFIVVYLT